jgi:hypothetical protein
LEQDEQQESIDQPPVSTAASPPPSTLSYAVSNGRKRRYESTREFFDADPDYFEYISMQTPTQCELEQMIKYPPQPFIPTTPRVMFDHHQKNSLHYTPKKYHHQHRYLKNDIETTRILYDYSLPPNWGATTTLDGYIYYCIVKTINTTSNTSK